MTVRLLEITADAATAASASSFIRDRRHSAICEPHPSFKPLDIDARCTHCLSDESGACRCSGPCCQDSRWGPSSVDRASLHRVSHRARFQREIGSARDIDDIRRPAGHRMRGQGRGEIEHEFFSAPSVNVNLTGADSAIETTLSGIHATADGLLVTIDD